METGIPVATDNIYKFYALFGLLLFISCGFGFVYVNNIHNDDGYRVYKDIQALEAIENRSKTQEDDLAVQRQQLSVLKSDYLLYLRVLSWGLAIGIVAMTGGFVVWQFKVQPEQDRLTKFQLEKLELEIAELRKPTSVSTDHNALEIPSNEDEWCSCTEKPQKKVSPE